MTTGGAVTHSEVRALIEEDRPFRSFAKAALVRAARTFAQTAVALIPVGATIEAVDWRLIVGTAALSAVLSLLTSLATGLPEADEGPLGGEGE